MYPKTLYPKTSKVLRAISKLGFIKDWYLAGGTGLALQLGHRKSVDLDFFGNKFPKREILLGNIKSLKPKIIQEALGTLDTTIQDVKVSFLEYKYPLVGELTDFEGLKIASLLDIACMKVTAISSRSSKKDFIDLYFILEKYSLSELFKTFDKKYKDVDYQKLHLLKSILYFYDAESDPAPDMMGPFDWDGVKKSLEGKAMRFLKSEGMI